MARRRAIGAAVSAGRVLGVLFIVLAILTLPPMKALTGGMASTLNLISSILLAMAGIVCLTAIRMFVRFFDQFLSRN